MVVLILGYALLLTAFTHKSSVTVAELRDYITRRKNKKISIVKGGKNACTRSRIRIGSVNPIPTKGGRLCPPHY